MAIIVKECPESVAILMAGDDPETFRWLNGATFAETNTGHWLAWHGDEPDRMAVLSPGNVNGEGRHWFYLSDGESIETAIAQVESGEFDQIEPFEWNMTIIETKSAPVTITADYEDFTVAKAYLESFIDGTVDYGNPDQVLARLEIIYKKFGEGDLKDPFSQAANAFTDYALRATADLCKSI